MDYKSLLGPQDFSSPEKIANWINDAITAISALISDNESLKYEIYKGKSEKKAILETYMKNAESLQETAVECERIKVQLSAAKSLATKLDMEKSAAVKDLRQMCVGGNTCAFCAQDRKCGKAGPGRKTVETCWEWRGPQAGC